MMMMMMMMMMKRMMMNGSRHEKRRKKTVPLSPSLRLTSVVGITLLGFGTKEAEAAEVLTQSPPQRKM